MKIKGLVIFSIIYEIILVSFCIYWSNNFARFTIMKGDYASIFVEILLLLTYFFYLIIQFTIERINFLFALLVPIITCILTFLVGLLFLTFASIEDIPRNEILIVGLFYGLITLLSVYKFGGINKQ